MGQIGESGPLTVLCCRVPEGSESGSTPTIYDASRDRFADPDVERILAAVMDPAQTAAGAGATAPLEAGVQVDVHLVGPRPGKAIDPLLTGRVLVVGDDSDLNAVVLRLVRRDLLGAVQLAFAAPRPTAVTDLYALPIGPKAVELARFGEVDLVPLVRSDAGGVLVGAAQLAPITGTFYVDEHRIAGGSARVIQVEPDAREGVAVTVLRRRFAGFGPRPRTYYGRAVEFGILPGSDTAIIYDGIRHPRSTNRWVFFQHTDKLRLIRGLY